MSPHATKGFARNRVEGDIIGGMSPEKEPGPGVAPRGAGSPAHDATPGGAVPGSCEPYLFTSPSEQGHRFAGELPELPERFPGT